MLQLDAASHKLGRRVVFIKRIMRARSSHRVGRREPSRARDRLEPIERFGDAADLPPLGAIVPLRNPKAWDALITESLTSNEAPPRRAARSEPAPHENPPAA